MDAVANKQHEPKENKFNLFELFSPKPKKKEIFTKDEANWVGMQLIQRTKGTNEIYFRSFPFWGPSEEWALKEAHRTNKLKAQDKTFWTHLLVFVEITETNQGHTLKNKTEIKEIAL